MKTMIREMSEDIESMQNALRAAQKSNPPDPVAVTYYRGRLTEALLRLYEELKSDGICGV